MHPKLFCNKNGFMNNNWIWTKQSLSKWQHSQLYSFYNAKNLLQGTTNNSVRFTFSVGDTTWAVYNEYWARQIELVTLNTIVSGPLSCNDCLSPEGGRLGCLPGSLCTGTQGNMGTSSSPRFERRWLVVFCSVLFCFVLCCCVLLCFASLRPLLSHTIPPAIGADLHLSSSLSYVLSLLLARPHFFFLNSARMKRDRDFSWVPTNSASRPRLTSMNCSANRSGVFEFESCSHLWVWLSCVAVPDVCGNLLRNWLRWQVVTTARMISRARRITRVLSARTWCGRSIIGAL